MKGLIILGLGISPFYFAQTTVQDSLKTSEISEVKLLKKLPVTKEIILVKNLENKNLGQDLPVLLKNQTAVETTSDAGNGIGYTGLKIRGVDGTRINVMLNGVPYNDSESQGSFFVNLPDITSTASQIIIQRGVGTSTNGVAAFGASVNILSRDPSEKAYFSTQNSFGSYNSHKNSFELASGSLLNGKLSMTGRYSIIKSDGYIDRASSDLSSYNFVALYKNGKTKLRFLTFGGKEKTYQAWNGISKIQYENNPTYNSSGEIYDAAGDIVGYYDDETDNYKQQHYHFLWEQTLAAEWKLNTTLHYTKGKGFYNNYKSNQKFSKYGLPNIIIGGQTINRADLIRKKWLDNDFYGVISTLYGKLGNLDLNFGAVANQYYGRHFGNVTGVFLPQIDEHEYYRNNSVKNEVSGFAKAIYKLNQFEFFGDLQLRNINYDTKIVQQGDGEGADLYRKWTFFNPKVGVNFNIENGKVFVSYANAHREPNRDDLFANPSTKEETLHDFEAGWEQQFGKVVLTANAYYMDYQNQLVLSGRINNVGEFIRQNVDKSYRLGIELSAQSRLSDKIQLGANLSLSQNKIKEINSVQNNTDVVLKDSDISFSPNIIANGNVVYSPFKNFNLGVTAQYVGKQYLDNLETADNQLKDYLVPDFNMSYKLPFQKQEVTLRFLLNNFTNTKYVNNGFSGPYYFAQAGINFLFGVSLKFK